MKILIPVLIVIAMLLAAWLILSENSAKKVYQTCEILSKGSPISEIEQHANKTGYSLSRINPTTIQLKPPTTLPFIAESVCVVTHDEERIISAALERSNLFFFLD